MNLHRSLMPLRWFVMSWFCLSLGAALATPLLQPRAMSLVCTGNGATLLVQVNDDGAMAATDSSSADCLLCLIGAAPPAGAQASHPPLPTYGTRPAWPALQQVALHSTPLPPARAPPFCVSPS